MGRAEFADRVDRLLDNKDLDELARASGLKNKSAFSHYRVGKRTPNFDRLAALCRALDVSADYLLGLTEEMRPISAVAEVSPEYHAEPEEFVKIRLRCPHCDKVIERSSSLGEE
jgi:transcriptional regulator with XRE-family HTH domain